MEQKHYKTMLLIVAFILIQPVIDILTTASILYIDFPITVGIVLRVLYLIGMSGFLVWMATKSKRAKAYFIYLAGLGGILLINFVVNYLTKDPYLLVEELTFYSKVVYFHVLFFGFLAIFQELQRMGTKISHLLIRYFVIIGTTIGIVFVLAHLTNTSLANYARSKEGWTAWFYAGNEIGAAMAIILPVVALYAIYKTTHWKQAYYWVPFILLSFGLLALGTKVGYGGVLLTILVGLFASGLFYFVKKDRSKRVRTNFVITALLLVVLLVITPVTPVFGNMFAHLNILGFDVTKEDVLDKKAKDKDKSADMINELPQLTGDQLENLVFSSREQYRANYKEQFQDAPFIQKAFGMGYAGNYEEPRRHQPLKTIEMDFHDWFYSFGYIGFLYFVAPLIYFTIMYIGQFIRRFKESWNYFNLLTGSSFIIGIGIAYTAGHVFTAPAVSIYLAFLFAAMIIAIYKEGDQLI